MGAHGAVEARLGNDGASAYDRRFARTASTGALPPPQPHTSCGPRCLTPLPLGTPNLRAWILASSFGSPGGHEVLDSTASDARWVLGVCTCS